VGIGYHYYVRKDGTIYRGRPEDTVGAHVYGYNSVSIGVCAEGDYTKETMPAPQKEALILLVKDLKKRYPNARIVGHKDLAATACPGGNFPLDELKSIKEEDNMLLKVGSRGEAVKKLQENLNRLGFNCGAADGIFGPNTEAAVRAFQKAYGLAVDGIAGPATLGKIDELLKAPNVKQLQDTINSLNKALQEANEQLNKYRKVIDDLKRILNSV